MAFTAINKARGGMGRRGRGKRPSEVAEEVGDARQSVVECGNEDGGVGGVPGDQLEEEEGADEEQEQEDKDEDEEDEQEEEAEDEEEDKKEVRRAESIRENSLSQFESDWGQPLKNYIKNWKASHGPSKGRPHSSRSYYTSYFAEKGKLTTRTLRAFETLALLTPSEAQRSEAIADLIQSLERRNKTRPGVGSIGRNGVEQDRNLRFEAKALIKLRDNSFEDSEVDDKEHKITDTTGDDLPGDEAPNTEDPDDAPQNADDDLLQLQPAVQDEKEQRLQVIKAIYDHWDETILNYLPDNAHPKGNENVWPLQFLEPLLEFSKATAHMDPEEIFKILNDTGLFGDKKKYGSKKSLRYLENATDRAKRRAVVGARVDASQSSTGVEDKTVKPAVTAPAAPGDGNQLQSAATVTQTPPGPDTEPHQAPPQSRTTRPAEDHLDNQAPPAKRHRPNQTITAVASLTHLSPEDRHRYQIAVLACRKASSALTSAEIEVELARTRKSAASERGFDSAKFGHAVLEANAEVQRKAREVMDAQCAVLEIVGVVGDEMWEEVWGDERGDE